MKRRTLVTIIELIIASFLGLWLQLFLHEAGHAIFAMIAKNRIVDFKLGLLSYVEVNVTNPKSILLITLGAFVVPFILSIILFKFKSLFLNFLALVVGSVTWFQLAINLFVVISETNYMKLKTYDFGLLLNYGYSRNNMILLVLVLAIIMMLILIKNLNKKIIA